MVWRVMCLVTAKDLDPFSCVMTVKAKDIDSVVDKALEQIRDPWPADPVITGVLVSISQA